ncbi:MAG: DUF4253 domain-containing protein [Paludibacteraceae bacterium]|nr:DUF4253 domain-containing protein [Paludibacteraceae bacterium]
MMHIIPPINRIVKFFLSVLLMILLCMPIQAQIDEWLQRLEKHNPNYPVYCDSDTITIKEYNQRLREMAKAHEEEGMSGAKFFGILFGVALTISFIIGSIVIVMARREQRREAEKERKWMEDKKDEITQIVKEREQRLATEQEKTFNYEELSSKEKALYILRKLGCEINIIGPANSIDSHKLTQIYEVDQNKKLKRGRISVVVALDDLFVDNLLIEYEPHLGEALQPYLQSKLAMPLLDAEDILNSRLEWIKENYEDMDWDEAFVQRKRNTVCELNDIPLSGHQEDTLAIIALPIDALSKAYDVLCYIPFGGANSPEAMEHRSIIKYWMDKFSIVPVFFSGSEVVYQVDVDKTSQMANELSLQHLAYCEESITQSDMGLEDIELSIERSRFWYFWWD